MLIPFILWHMPFFVPVGVKCAVVEKNRSFSKHPQAHFINNRSMEVDWISLNEYAIPMTKLKIQIDVFIQNWLIDISQIGWTSRGDTIISTTCRVMEKVHLLYVTEWYNSRICGPYATTRYYFICALVF